MYSAGFNTPSGRLPESCEEGGEQEGEKEGEERQ